MTNATLERPNGYLEKLPYLPEDVSDEEWEAARRAFDAQVAAMHDAVWAERQARAQANPRNEELNRLSRLDAMREYTIRSTSSNCSSPFPVNVVSTNGVSDSGVCYCSAYRARMVLGAPAGLDEEMFMTRPAGFRRRPGPLARLGAALSRWLRGF